MRLADFIEQNTDPIMADWVAFAERCGPAGQSMTAAQLRDHAIAMLAVIVKDLRTPQTAGQQREKATGDAMPSSADPETAAEVHGSGRAESGFTIGEMVAEYRALRASVIRLWTKSEGSLTGDDLEDLMRFNEAIDQSLAESVTRYTEDIDHSKEIFLAILGHDLRTPLGAVMMASQFILETGEFSGTHQILLARILRSAERMNQMVRDLLDFTRSRLGSGMPITRAPMDLAVEAAHAVEEVSAANPAASVKLEHAGNLTGAWDHARLGQVMTNLLGNAVQHGGAGTSILMSACGEPAAVVLRVHNCGSPIPPAALPGLFSPFKRLQPGEIQSPSGSLGLGLYIVERIVSAHGGTIGVTSTASGGTEFTVRLPRYPEVA